ncbi:NYN domain-containing protein [Candidatus Thiothrix sp. Deng01]|uniref:NYN domain-containing protein n=1 Tax=Candidatus Thiothrix phosphatis TaxID=3112415 RepID=A0ABU6CSA1_9GAMM|nr:NYN domain-containing protein [Candidatus Thiothrix sp. Deng01]MEB4589664.1 NYN domain-containing protein [Candidatus Thiothrix sp. Deng01]
MKRVSLFVDVQNIYYTTRDAYGRGFDYNRFWAQATAGRQVVQACAYAIGRGDEKQKQFQNILRAIGFEVKLKPYIQRSDGSAKGDWDVGITLDVIEAAASADIIVLASGDGDFDLLLRKAHDRYGVETEAYGVPGLTANSLIQAATRYVPIDGGLLLKAK